MQARVFHMHLQNLMGLIRDGSILGRRAVYVLSVVEFQKRGLPHAHIAFRVEGPQPTTAEEIDAHISAEVPVLPTEADVWSRMGDVPTLRAGVRCNDDTAAALGVMRELRAAVPALLNVRVPRAPAALYESQLLARAQECGPNTPAALAQQVAAMAATLRDVAEKRRLYDIVTSMMMHRECRPERCFKRSPRAPGAVPPDTRTSRVPSTRVRVPRAGGHPWCALS